MLNARPLSHGKAIKSGKQNKCKEKKKSIYYFDLGDINTHIELKN